MSCLPLDRRVLVPILLDLLHGTGEDLLSWGIDGPETEWTARPNIPFGTYLTTLFSGARQLSVHVGLDGSPTAAWAFSSGRWYAWQGGVWSASAPRLALDLRGDP